MYTTFFGFKQKPFQLVPNPAFLFLSQGHEEAMAHLRYAVSHGDGFVAITGEVGTGKTTLCRAFLNGLGNNTEAAYIFNPRLDDIQLLQAINDEFGINAKAASVKELIDELNRFLMAQRQAGKTVLLLIDEAQNLSAAVLEQLRLLSNLETTTAKLLQIILVGQPELEELLNSHKLRQLAQRITLRCRLQPMSARETTEYIRHRLHQVSQRPRVIFTRGALRRVHRYANGVPRLINIVCERALLTAFTLEQRKITGRTVSKAISELIDTKQIERRSFFRSTATAMAVVIPIVVLALLVLFPGVLWHHPAVTIQPAAEIQPPPLPPEPVMPLSSVPRLEEMEAPPQIALPEEGALTTASQPSPESQPPPLPMPMSAETLQVMLTDMDSQLSRTTAIRQILALWRIESDHPDTMPSMPPLPDASANAAQHLRLAFGRHGMQVHGAAADLSLIEQLDLPAILLLTVAPDSEPRFVAVCGMTDTMVLLQGEAGPLPVDKAVLESFWTGQAYVPWKNFRDLAGTVPINASPDAILALKLLLTDLGLIDGTPGPEYDAETSNAVLEAQARHGIDIDGIVGPATKIVLYNEDPTLIMPHLAGNATTACGPPPEQEVIE